MKIVVVHGSMRNGNTYKLTQDIIKRLKEKPEIEIKEISVSKLSLPFCCSCHQCFERGENKCPHHEIVGSVVEAFKESDGIILSGTTYMWELNAAMKNLLDHLSYMFHRPCLFGKHGMVIATAAGTGEKIVTKYLATVLGQWGINGAITVTRTSKQESFLSVNPKLVKKEARTLNKATEKFYNLIKNKKIMKPTAKAITVHNAFRAMSLSEFSSSAYDTEYWKQDGFKNKAYPVKAGVFKLFLGGLVFVTVNVGIKMMGKKFNKMKKKSIITDRTVN